MLYLKQGEVERPPNTTCFMSKYMGVRVYCVNVNYTHKKSHAGIIVGTDLSWEHCATAQRLFRVGWTKKLLMQRYNLSRYYLNKVLSLCL